MAVAMVLFISGTVHSASFSFDGPIVRRLYSNISFSVDDITLTATAPGEKVAYYWEGLGVKDAGVLGSIQNNEVLKISFDKTVDISELCFRQWEGPDEITFTASNGISIRFDNSSYSTGLFDYFTLGAAGEGIDYFTITGETIGTSTWFKGLTAELVASSVPVPGTMMLLGTGLLVFSGMKRKKRVK